MLTPALKELKYLKWPQTRNMSIQRNRKDIYDDFKLKKPLVSMV